MTRKNEFDKLCPADQIAIEEMVSKAKPEELKEIYKEIKSKEAIKKRPMGIAEFVGILILIVFVLAIFFLPMIQMTAYEIALKGAGLDICKAHNSTYKDVDFSGFTHVKIICTDLKITLP